MIACGVVAVLAAAACCQQQAGEASREPTPIRPADINRQEAVPWHQVDTAPDWVGQVPVAPARLHYLVTHTGGGPRLTQDRCARDSFLDSYHLLREHLAPALGLAKSDAVVRAALDHTALVEATWGMIPTRDRGQGGMNYGIAWCLWCVDVRGTVGALEPADQGHVEWLLSRPIVRWQEVEAVPEGFGAPARVRGMLRLHFSHEGKTFALARESSLTQVRDACAVRLRKALAPVLTAAQVDAAVASGLRRLSPAQREYRHHSDPDDNGVERHRVTTYELWEIPLAGILRDLPQQRHAAVAKALGVEPD
ncbi:MAG: hypothetical protein H6838_05925 [Planctomycetes bacterium]|nr:hypothetical protein [Planctomycetota bacterium]MCB9885009.1 hypothetical protein [Planctomycetota bacterium]